MKIGVRLFLSSMVFALAIASVYGWTTHDAVGVVLLATMAIALITLAVWVVVAQRESALAADRPDADPKASAGENLGVFTTESYWPILGAAATTLMTIGIVFLPGASATASLLSGALLFFILRFLVREST